MYRTNVPYPPYVVHSGTTFTQPHFAMDENRDRRFFGTRPFLGPRSSDLSFSFLVPPLPLYTHSSLSCPWLYPLLTSLVAFSWENLSSRPWSLSRLSSQIPLPRPSIILFFFLQPFFMTSIISFTGKMWSSATINHASIFWLSVWTVAVACWSRCHKEPQRNTAILKVCNKDRSIYRFPFTFPFCDM